MHAHDRLLAVLRGQPVDRLPIWLLTPYHPVAYYADVPRLPAWREVWASALERAIHLDRRHFSWPTWTGEVTESTAQRQEDGWQIQEWGIHHRGRQLRSMTRSDGTCTHVRKMLTSDEELELFCSLPLELDPGCITAALDSQLSRYRQEVDEFPTHLGSMMLDLEEPISLLYHRCDLESFALWSLTHRQLIQEWLDRRMRQYRVAYDWCLQKRLAEVYFLLGSELASPPLVSVDTFRHWIIPYAQELIARIHAAGAFAIQHYHGHIAAIIGEFPIMGADALHTIEAPPVGNCTFAQAFAATQDRLALIGNIQYDCFRSYQPDQMRQAVAEVVEECRGHRLILSPSAGPFDPDLSPGMAANYLAFLDAGWNARWP